MTSSFSISVRVRRVTTEDAYVAVPIAAVMCDDPGSGNHCLDVEALQVEAVRIAEHAHWRTQEQAVDVHPIQGPVEDQRCGDWPAPCNCDDPATHGGRS